LFTNNTKASSDLNESDVKKSITVRRKNELDNIRIDNILASKILNLYLLAVNSNNADGRAVAIDVQSLCDKLGIQRVRNEVWLSVARCLAMKQLFVPLYSEDGFSLKGGSFDNILQRTSFLSASSSPTGRSIIYMEPSKEAVDLFFGYDKEYHNLPISVLMSFDSAIDHNIYVNLQQRLFRGTWEVDLKEFLGLVYPEGKMSKFRWDNFEDRQLKPCIERINRDSDIKVKYKAIKGGRNHAVQGLEFKITKNPNYVEIVEDYSESYHLFRNNPKDVRLRIAILESLELPISLGAGEVRVMDLEDLKKVLGDGYNLLEQELLKKSPDMGESEMVNYIKEGLIDAKLEGERGYVPYVEKKIGGTVNMEPQVNSFFTLLQSRFPFYSVDDVNMVLAKIKETASKNADKNEDGYIKAMINDMSEGQFRNLLNGDMESNWNKTVSKNLKNSPFFDILKNE